MSDAPTLSKEELQVNWRAWVIANLGQDPDRVTLAANAAVDAVLQGKTLAVASAAATNAWSQAGGRPPSWRLTFWGLLVADPSYLGAAAFLIVAQVLWLSPAGALSILIDLLFLPPLALRLVKVMRLSRRGIVAPGVLVRSARVYLSRGNTYTATYEFDHGGRHFATRIAADTPNDVLVFFDPGKPSTAIVVPLQLSTSGR